MSRRRGRPWGSIAAALVLAALAAWSVVIEPRWVAARVEPLGSAQWQPPAGLKVAVASDWHLSTRSLWRVTSADRAAAIVDQINAAQPDVILLPGDFLAGSGDDEDFSIEAMAAVLGRLKAPQGVYAVLGNHDWWHDGERTARPCPRKAFACWRTPRRACPGTNSGWSASATTPPAIRSPTRPWPACHPAPPRWS
ncbi:metallophosphoesterase [Variovorax boronicumulans]